jgi:hypothetical protein
VYLLWIIVAVILIHLSYIRGMGYTFPTSSSFSNSLTYTKTMIMGTLWDDAVVEQAQDEGAVLCELQALAGEPVDCDNSWKKALKHVGDEYERFAKY